MKKTTKILTRKERRRLPETISKLTWKEKRAERKLLRKQQNEKELEEFLNSIDINNYDSSTKRREVALFCTRLFSNMKFKHRWMFVIKGRYPYPLRKTYEELMKKKSKEKIKAEKAKQKELERKKFQEELDKAVKETLGKENNS